MQLVRHGTRPFALAALVAAPIGLTTLAGCGRLDPSLGARLAAAAAPYSPTVDDDRAVAAAGEAVAAGETAAPDRRPLPPDAGLETYVAQALVHNPTIQKVVRAAEALGQRVPQVTSLDDPMVVLVPPTDDMIETAAGMMDGSVGVSQTIPFPGKLRTRGRIAEQAVRIALDRVADARIRTVADVRRAYHRYYLAHVTRALSRESADLLGQACDVATARYRAGAAAQADVLGAEIELHDLTNRVLTAERERATAAADLNALMNRAVDAPLPPPGPVDLTAVTWRLDQATAAALVSNPELAALRDRVRRDLEAVHLARLEYLPDLTVGYTYTAIAAPSLSPVATGEDAWDLALGLNLPIWWQRRRARVLQGNAQVLGTVAEYEEARNAVAAGLQDALARIDTQYRQAILSRDVIVPRAWEAVEVGLARYQAGSLEFAALLARWRTGLRQTHEEHRALAALEQAFADLEQLIGVRIGREPGPVALANEGRDER